MDFQGRIQQLIKAEGVDALSKRLGVSRQTVYNWKGGHTQPTLGIIEQIGGKVWFPGDAEPAHTTPEHPTAHSVAAAIPNVSAGIPAELTYERDDYSQ